MSNFLNIRVKILDKISDLWYSLLDFQATIFNKGESVL